MQEPAYHANGFFPNSRQEKANIGVRHKNPFFKLSREEKGKKGMCILTINSTHFGSEEGRNVELMVSFQTADKRKLILALDIKTLSLSYPERKKGIKECVF